MEDNKDLTPEVEANEVKQTEVAEGASSTPSETASKGKAKKDKKPMPKKKKIIIATACGVLGAIVLGFVIWLLVFLLSPSGTQGLSTIALKMDMDELPYYIGTEGEFDPAKIYPEGVLSSDKTKLTYKKDGKTDTKEVITIDGAVNVSTFDELVTNINAGKAVCIQNSFLQAPKYEGMDDGVIPTMTLTNNVYGNGAKLDVNEIATTRFKGKDGKIGAATDGLGYGSKYVSGTTVFVVKENDAQILFQDVYVCGNDLSREEGGDLANVVEGDKLIAITDEQMQSRGVKLFSGYGDLFNVSGSTDKKANVKISHCIFDSGHKVVHIAQAGNVDLEGSIIRNAADTALSIGTFANYASTINSKNNVIVSSLTGGIVFYCYTGDITEANAKSSWNTLNVEGFLDIYNWKAEKGLVFMPETEGFADVGNRVAGDTIPSVQYDDLKGYDKEGNKYIHFAIIKLKTGGGVPRNDSTVNFKNDIGFTTSSDNGMDDGFPIPDFAKMIAVKQVDVWGYYSKDNGAVTPNSIFDDDATLAKLYKELKNGRK